MLIDWFTTIAQIANFLILVFLLKHFLYGPIVKAMEKREHRISRRLDDAEATKKEATEKKKQFEDKKKELQRQKQEILDEAEKQAENQLRQRMQEIRFQGKKKQQQWTRDIESQKQSFVDELARLASDQVLLTVSRAFEDLADESLQEKMTKVFINKLKNLDKQIVQQLRKELDEEKPTVTITAVFEIDSGLKQKITRIMHDLLGKNTNVVYEFDGHLSAGLKLESSNEIIAWNLEEYLSGLKENIMHFMDRKKITNGTDRQDEEKVGKHNREKTEQQTDEKSDQSELE